MIIRPGKIKKNHDEGMEVRILEVARELFLERGFAMTSTVEIARRVGCNQALVHYYFRSKEQLFGRIFEEQVKEFSLVIFKIGEQGRDFCDRLQRLIEAHFDMIARDRRLPFLILSEVMTHPERLGLLRDAVEKLPIDMIQRLRTDVETAVAEGLIRPISFQDFVMNIVALNVGSFLSLPVLENVAGLNPDEIEAFLINRRKEVVTTILNSLRP